MSFVRTNLSAIPNANFFGQQTFLLQSVLPYSNRGIPFNFISNINSYTTQSIDPTGAPSVDLLGNPAPGRFTLFTITNDDPFNNMIGNPIKWQIIMQKEIRLSNVVQEEILLYR